MAPRALVKALEKKIFLRGRLLSKNVYLVKRKEKPAKWWFFDHLVGSSQGFLRILGPGKKKIFFFFLGKKKHKKLANTLWENFFFVLSESRMSFKNGKDLHWKKIFLSFYKKSWIFPKKWPKKLCRVTHAKYLIFQEVKKKIFPNVQKNCVESRFFCLSWKIGFFEIFLSVSHAPARFFFTSWNLRGNISKCTLKWHFFFKNF